MTYPYNGILFSNKKEWNTNPYGNMDGHYAKCSVKEARHKRRLNVWFQIYEMSREGNFSETESSDCLWWKVEKDLEWGWTVHGQGGDLTEMKKMF